MEEIKQYRYYGANNSNNVPSSYVDWLDNIIKDYSVKKLGIQSLPGIEFNIDSGNIIINHTGIYEIDLSNTTTSIKTLSFAPESLMRIEETPNSSIIVDFYYQSTNKE